MRGQSTGFAVAACAAVGMAACTDDGGQNEVSRCEAPAPAAEHALAAQIADASQLLEGPQALGRVGDFVLSNREVVFIIEGLEPSGTWLPMGGQIIDAALRGGRDHFMQLAPLAGFVRGVRAEQIDIVNDGSNGCAAVLRVKGRDAGVHYIDAGGMGILPPSDVEVTTEYRLEPGARHVTVDSEVRDLREPATPRTVQMGDLVLVNDALSSWVPDLGFEPDLMGAGPQEFIAGVVPQEVSYGWVADGEGYRITLDFDEALIATALNLRFGDENATERSFRRHLLVGDGSVTSLQRELARLRGEAPGIEVTGRVALPDGAPVAGARVEARSRQGGALSLAHSDAEGAFTLLLPEGPASIVASKASHGEAEVPVTPSADGSAVALTLTPPALLQLSMPHGARIRLVPAEASDPLTAPGPELLAGRGDERFEVAQGNYQAVVMRGFEYEVAVVPLLLNAGETASLDVTLPRVVDTSGYISADFHTHMSPSIDSDVSPTLRVRQAAAEGLELLVTTDHDIVSDLVPTIAAEGLEGIVRTAAGVEVSPVYGHMNGFPLDPSSPETHGYFPVPWPVYDASGAFVEMMPPTQVFADLTGRLGAQVVQVNHGRSFDALFDFFGLDPAVGFSSVDSAQIDRGFHAIEVANAKDLDALEVQLADVFAAWRDGFRLAATGNSDSHGLGRPVGFPRNMVQASGEVLADVDLNDVWTSVREQRLTVCGGPFVTATVEGEAAQRELHVRVQAPSWVGTDTIEVLVAGETFTSIDIRDRAEVLRFDERISLGPHDDTWVMVRVHSDAALAPVVPGKRAFAFTNPLVVGSYP